MKYIKMVRILSILFFISLFMTILPAAPALAANSLYLDPDEGAIGDTIDITGRNFSYSTDTDEKWARIIFSSDEASVGENIDDEVDTYKVVEEAQIGYLDEDDEGDFEGTFEVPSRLSDGDDDEDVSSGTYYIYVTITYQLIGVNDIIRAVEEFTVNAGEISLDTKEGTVGIEVTISGESFASDEDITVTYDGSDIDIEDGDDSTDSSGNFEAIILIPDSSVGKHTIAVNTGDNEAVEAEFTVESSMEVTPQSGETDTKVIVIGTGFARRKTVGIYLANKQVATTVTDSSGSFATDFMIPKIDIGNYVLEADDGANHLVQMNFRITGSTTTPTTAPPQTVAVATPQPQPIPIASSIQVNPTKGNTGASIVVSGTGFTEGKTVSIKLDAQEVSTATVQPMGIFVAIFSVPTTTKAGDHIVIVSDGTRTAQSSLTVETMPPSVPTLLTPEMGTTLKSPITLDWQDVTAQNSPVTYALQIATDGNFTQESMVIQQEKLTKSEYTPTESEKSRLVSQSEPYYWRVKSIDSTNTESAWSSVGGFYVSQQFNMPYGIKYALFAIGGLLLLGVAYWLGRRTIRTSPKKG